MEIIVLIIIGLLAGLVAKFVMPGNDPGGIIVTTLLGIAGALLAGWLGPQLNVYEPEGAGGFARFVAAVVGAIVILIIYRLVARRRSA